MLKSHASGTKATINGHPLYPMRGALGGVYPRYTFFVDRSAYTCRLPNHRSSRRSPSGQFLPKLDVRVMSASLDNGLNVHVAVLRFRANPLAAGRGHSSCAMLLRRLPK